MMALRLLRVLIRTNAAGHQAIIEGIALLLEQNADRHGSREYWLQTAKLYAQNSGIRSEQIEAALSPIEKDIAASMARGNV